MDGIQFAYCLQVKAGVDLPNWVAYLTSSITFGGGLLGITYGIMSGAFLASLCLFFC